MQLDRTHSPQIFEGHTIRIYEHEGKKWLMGADVAKSLGRTSTSLFQCVSPSGRTLTQYGTYGGKQRAHIINEEGLQELEGRSRKESTKRFCQWAAREVFNKFQPVAAPAAAPVCKPSGVLAGCPFGFLIQMFQQMQQAGCGCACSCSGGCH